MNPVPSLVDDAKREAMRAALLAQGWNTADIDAAFPPALPVSVYRMRQGVTDAVEEMRRDLPRSVKTWEPYLQVYVDRFPAMCPCPCTACAAGPCPCPGDAAGHHDTCAMPEGDRHTDCAERYTGIADLPVAEVTFSEVAEAAWWAERHGLKRTVARNVKREAKGRNLLHSDGRGAREQLIQASRWMFTWLCRKKRIEDNPALEVKLPPRQEATARSLTPEEFGEVYGVAVSTGQDPTLDGLILRHLLIQGVRRGALLDSTCEGLDVANCAIRYWDQKKKTWRWRPTTRTHLADLVMHTIMRGPRVAAPPDASEEERRHGIAALTATSPVFYAQPVDTFDENGYFVSREVRPITRKRIELLFARIRRNLPWTENVELRCHDIRHTSGRLIYKAADQQMAKLHLAHDGGSTTDHYLKERLDELAKLKERLFEPQRDGDQP
jgi:site-specific recombinase XerD